MPSRISFFSTNRSKLPDMKFLTFEALKSNLGSIKSVTSSSPFPILRAFTVSFEILCKVSSILSIISFLCFFEVGEWLFFYFFKWEFSDSSSKSPKSSLMSFYSISELLIFLWPWCYFLMAWCFFSFLSEWISLFLLFNSKISVSSESTAPSSFVDFSILTSTFSFFDFGFYVNLMVSWTIFSAFSDFTGSGAFGTSGIFSDSIFVILVTGFSLYVFVWLLIFSGIFCYGRLIFLSNIPCSKSSFVFYAKLFNSLILVIKSFENISRLLTRVPIGMALFYCSNRF